MLRSPRSRRSPRGGTYEESSQSSLAKRWAQHGGRGDVDVVERVEIKETIDTAERDSQLATAITSSVLQGIAKMGFGDRHTDLMEAVTNITVDPPDLSPILRAIAETGTYERHSEVMEAITNMMMQPPVLSPIQRMLQELRSVIQRNGDDVRQDLRQELANLKKELLDNRKETRTDAEVLLSEIRALPQVLAELMQAIKRIKVEPDVRALADAIHDRMTSINIKVDNSEVTRAMKQLVPDHNAIASVVVEKMKPHVEHSYILDAVNRIKVPDLNPLYEAISKINLKVDHNTIADTVQDRFRRHTFNVDQSAVLQEIRKIKLDHGPVLEAIRKINLDHGPVLDVISSTQVDLEPIHRAIAGINLTVDHRPVLDAIKSIRIPDHQSSIDRLSKMSITVDHYNELLNVMKEIKLDADFDPVMHAINAAKVDFTPVLERIENINVQVNNMEVMQAIAEMRAEMQTLREVRVEQVPQPIPVAVPTTVMSVPKPQPQPVMVHAPMQQLQMVPSRKLTRVVQPPVQQCLQSWRALPMILRQPVQSLTTATQSVCCPFCNNMYMDDSNFCRKCGKPRQSTTVTAVQTQDVLLEGLSDVSPRGRTRRSASVGSSPVLERGAIAAEALMEPGERSQRLGGGFGSMSRLWPSRGSC